MITALTTLGPIGLSRLVGLWFYLTFHTIWWTITAAS